MGAASPVAEELVEAHMDEEVPLELYSHIS